MTYSIGYVFFRSHLNDSVLLWEEICLVKNVDFLEHVLK